MLDKKSLPRFLTGEQAVLVSYESGKTESPVRLTEKCNRDPFTTSVSMYPSSSCVTRLKTQLDDEGGGGTGHEGLRVPELKICGVGK